MRQRVGLGVAAVAVIGGLSWSVWSPTATDLVPLPTDVPLTSTTARELCATFRSAGLQGFQQSGEQILVPRLQMDQYAALLPPQRPTRDWAAEWERQNERLTPFSGSRALETNREIARAKLIAGMLRQLPDVEQADIVWDEDERPGWRQSPQTRATVYLNPKPDRVLTLDVIRAVRLAVAGSKKHLDPEDVVVMDLARQVTYEGTLPRAVGDDVLPLLRSRAELYRREIREQIRELSHADVAVRIDLPRFFEFLSGQGDAAPHRAPSAGRLSEAGPSLMRVNITLPPESNIETAAEENVRRSLQNRIAQLTGIGGEDPQERISVNFERPGLVPSNDARTHAMAGLLIPTSQKSHIIAAFLLTVVTVVLLALLSIRRRSAGQRAAGSTSPPAFHAVNGRSRQRDGTGRVADFDDLSRLDALEIQRIYSQATLKSWAVALGGSSSETRDQIAAALGPAAADELRQELKQLGPVRIGDIQSSRQRILETLGTLHEAV